MTTTEQIIREEAKRLAAGMLPLALLTLIGFALAGQLTLQVLLSLVLGVLYAFGLFLMIGANAARALLYPMDRAIVVARKGYAFRFLLTAALLVLVFKFPFFNPVAAILPLFYHKIVLLANSLMKNHSFFRKGG